MVLGFLRKVINYNEREVRRLREMAERINELEPEMERLSDEELARKTAEFRERIQNGASLDELLFEAFAVVREVSRRVLGMRHFDVQLMGGIVLHEGKIAEMKTGEGKTLVATLPVYLNALTGRGVHVVTVNDYLARRDSEWMGQIYRFLGLEVGLIVHGLDAPTRRRAYLADVTYGTNNEFGFDYLRDNMALSREEMVQRELHYAIVDEVDSILIDEARTPLIISGQAEKPPELYYKFARVVQQLQRDKDYTVDEKAHSVAPTEAGVAKVEKLLGVDNLYDANNSDLTRFLINALKAKELMKRDRDYVVKDGEVIIVDEFTGRLMFGRRWSDGLHQAVEAKEGLRIQRESQTLATITFQNYFRMYEKLAGMTGTAATEEAEFQKIYGLEVVVIPTHKPMIREDLPDVVYKTERAKYRAVVAEIKERYRRGQPVLVGTTSIEKSERLSEMLRREGIPHQVLNAKHHEREAEIVAQAGRLGTVTIATNMAGRGTDILLGGNPEFLARQELRKLGYPPEVISRAVELYNPPSSPEVAEAREAYRRILEEKRRETEAEHEKVVALGGLHIIGTERHESRRIDNQLRGRAGRQGDPGSTRFYLSLEDDLMRLFGGDMVKGLMDRLGMSEDEPIDHPMVSRAIETAQRKVEARNFEMRKHVLEYDDVMNQQREVIYGQRRQVLEAESIADTISAWLEEEVEELVSLYLPEKTHPEEWDLEGLRAEWERRFGFPLPWSGDGSLRRDEVRERLLRVAWERYREREERISPPLMRELEKFILLRTLDAKWIDHLDAMDELREGIGLRAYGQQDPLVQYKIEAYGMFQDMIRSLKEEVISQLFRVEVAAPLERRRAASVQSYREAELNVGQFAALAAGAEDLAGVGAGGPAPVSREPVRVQKVGRNHPCPCGSGKKYKKCCGREA